MDRLEGILKITKEIEKTIEQTVTVKNREEVIHSINELVAQRDIRLKRITPPFTEKEKISGQHTVILNGQIEKKMHILFEELKQDMQQMRKQKKTNRSYINSYGNLASTDGMFLDRKQ